MATVFVPPSMRHLTADARSVEVEATNVRALIDQLELHHPGFRDALLDGERLRSGLAIAIDGVTTTNGLLGVIPPGAEVHILPAIGGGTLLG